MATTVKQGLEQKLQQKLSPLQIQTIKLIEMPVQALEQHVREVLNDNPVLDELNTKMDSAREVAEKTDHLTTFNGWGKSESLIDYIYIKGFSACPFYQTVRKEYDGRKFISDHYPITAKVVF